MTKPAGSAPARRSNRKGGAKVRIGELFSGAGLFGQAFADRGAHLSFAIEMDPHAASSYSKNIGTHVELGRVEDLQPREKVDVIVAGPPCQGFSTLGRRDPKDARNRLCLVIPQWAKAAEAEVVVVENVPPFLASCHWLKMAKALERDGYEICTWTLDATEYGVPQRRVRSFTIASKRGLPSRPPATSDRIMVKEAFAAVRRNDPMHVWPKGTDLMAARMNVLPIGGDRRDIARAAPKLCPPSWHKIGCQATDVWGRMDLNAPANTLRCDFQNPSKGRYIHPKQDRMISLREGARLQQIPDEWIFEGHRTAITRQIGNGVPLGLGRAVASQVLALF